MISFFINYIELVDNNDLRPFLRIVAPTCLLDTGKSRDVNNGREYGRRGNHLRTSRLLVVKPHSTASPYRPWLNSGVHTQSLTNGAVKGYFMSES
jgi:hypothetical protein